jgi:hypothetical protein
MSSTQRELFCSLSACIAARALRARQAWCMQRAQRV